MRLLRWKVALPLLQLALAVCLWLYMPFQFSREMVALMRLIPEQVVGRGLDLSVETIHLYSPPLAGRLLYAMNFPAYVLSNKVEDLVMWRTTPAFQFTIEDTTRQLPVLYIFGVRELTFFVGICALWFWLGFRVDRFNRESELVSRPHRRWLHVTEMAASLAIGVILSRVCILNLMGGNRSLPERTIMTFGLLWPLLFFAVFCLGLKHELENYKQLGGSTSVT